tara:strand:- start:70 stop:630 length:561 start_codon:yes stop_codon:yes gene_type:complete
MSGGMQGGGGVPDDLLTTKGDTHGYTTENARVPIGVDSTVLTADSTTALGLAWAAAGGGTTITREIDSLSSSFSTTSNDKVNVTGLSIVLPSSGDCIVCYNGQAESNGTNSPFLDLYDGSTVLAGCEVGLPDASSQVPITLYKSMDMGSETLTIRLKSDGGSTALIRVSASANETRSASFEVTKFT